MGVFSSIVTEQFGARHFGLNYGIMVTGYSIAAFFGQRTASSIAATNNSDFSKAFYIAEELMPRDSAHAPQLPWPRTRS